MSCLAAELFITYLLQEGPATSHRCATRAFRTGRGAGRSREGSPPRDYNRLHYETGQPLEPRDELAQYLLMKVIAQASRGRRKAALGPSITGCFTTLWQSKEGKNAIASAVSGPDRGLLRILRRLSGSGAQVRDQKHQDSSGMVTVPHSALEVRAAL